ncbi:hypothetical protein TWF694_009438 [Orbilia ellipsospora]|uniref:Uncharacterized protein n=1 Tax=Orbilia ellipsospora TaxID=2528407 RepID=A0AAV9XC56_9PEZI
MLVFNASAASKVDNTTIYDTFLGRLGPSLRHLTYLAYYMPLTAANKLNSLVPPSLPKHVSRGLTSLSYALFAEDENFIIPTRLVADEQSNTKASSEQSSQFPENLEEVFLPVTMTNLPVGSQECDSALDMMKKQIDSIVPLQRLRCLTLVPSSLEARMDLFRTEITPTRGRDYVAIVRFFIEQFLSTYIGFRMVDPCFASPPKLKWIFYGLREENQLCFLVRWESTGPPEPNIYLPNVTNIMDLKASLKSEGDYIHSRKISSFIYV